MTALPGPAAAHVARLDAALIGPRRAKRELLAEIADHLEDATDAYRVTGRTPGEAAELAVAEFGTVDDVRAGFQSTLAVAASRRTALWLLLALVPQPFLWDSGVLASLHVVAADGGDTTDGWFYGVLDVLVEWGGFVAILSAVLTIVATGIGRRWLPARRGAIRCAAVAALVTAVMMTTLAATMVATSPDTTPVLWPVVAALLGLPLGLAAVSARRTLAALRMRPTSL